MKRIEALALIDNIFEGDPLIVTCGATARELASFSRRDTHLPLLDAMGLTSAVGLGVALGYPGSVGVIDGDGSLLMGFSILPTLAIYAPANLIVIVLDNEQHASADLVPSQSAHVDLAAATRGLGLHVETCNDLSGLGAAVSSMRASGTFGVIFAKIEPGNSADIPLLLADPAVLGATFTRAVDSRGAR